MSEAKYLLPTKTYAMCHCFVRGLCKCSEHRELEQTRSGAEIEARNEVLQLAYRMAENDPDLPGEDYIAIWNAAKVYFTEPTELTIGKPISSFGGGKANQPPIDEPEQEEDLLRKLEQQNGVDIPIGKALLKYENDDRDEAFTQLLYDIWNTAKEYFSEASELKIRKPIRSSTVAVPFVVNDTVKQPPIDEPEQEEDLLRKLEQKHGVDIPIGKALLKYENDYGEEAFTQLLYGIWNAAEKYFTQDTKRIDYLENESFGSALVSDDDGHWAVSNSGFQNCPMNTPDDIQTTFFIKKNEWKNSVREAIDSDMKNED